MQTNRLDAHQLTHTYGQGDSAAPALADLSLTIGANGPEAVAIMGPSGSGKSTLLHVLAGIIAPDAGRVVWRGSDLATMRDSQRTKLRRSDFGFVFQSGQLLPELPAIENVALPLMLGGGLRSGAEAAAGALLHRLGLGGMLHRRPGELSGGQAQRVAIARALVGDPGLVFADEPTGALDRSTGQAVMALLIGATLGHGASLVVVTHDAEVAAACSRVIRLEDGRIVSDGPGDAAPGALQQPQAAERAPQAQPHAQAQAYARAQAQEAPGSAAATAPAEPEPVRWGAKAAAHPAPYGAPNYGAPTGASAPLVPTPVSYGMARGEQRVANPMQQWIAPSGTGAESFGDPR
ncbi:putative ABC transport system ATP-binding protein [Agrococcus baldri]|uniref:ABC transport system ATP-binding protein n=1 Tax=Agrococcus baldri TaxID=153730 RepID=A0AA94HMG9_9MICO|nr:ABC transporter ATP-binding protein [Agrococcus baldri]SFS10931.1 putative ABC transport system ATP-binding protein [Agrococcus baldri]